MAIHQGINNEMKIDKMFALNATNKMEGFTLCGTIQVA